MARPPSAPLDDAYRSIIINDFSGGLVTVASSLSLASNQSPDMLNVIHLPGRLLFRGGYDYISDPFPAGADAAYPFYDSVGAKHYVVWANGNVYDVVNGNLQLIEAGVYTAGQRIGHVAHRGILYWSSGQPVPVPMRFWKPSDNTKGPVTNSGAPGSADPPASDFLFLYLNSIVALAPTWGAPLVATTYQPNVFIWCATDDPTTWIGSSSQAVGDMNTGRVEFGRPFGIADVGVAPFRTIIIGRNDFGVYAYEGALGSLEERLLNCPVGMKDRDSVQYLPTDNSFGTIIWLGTDGQVWGTNGINATVKSGPIQPTITQAYTSALVANPGARFFSGYNQDWQYYWVDISGTQFMYRWETNSWSKFSGWPSGPSFASFDSTGAPAYFVASAGPSNAALAQIGLMGVPDDGSMPSVYWKSPYLHAGNFNIFKDFHWCAVATYDGGVTYVMDASSIKRQDNSAMVANPMNLVAPSDVPAGTGPFILGSSILGGPDVLSSSTPVTGLGGVPVVLQGRFAVPIPADTFMPEGHFETLKGNACQISISHEGDEAAFDLLGVEVQYVPRGYRRGSGTLYNPEALTGQPFDPYSGR
jgi:hypothetical protein